MSGNQIMSRYQSNLDTKCLVIEPVLLYTLISGQNNVWISSVQISKQSGKSSFSLLQNPEVLKLGHHCNFNLLKNIVNFLLFDINGIKSFSNQQQMARVAIEI